MSALTSVRNWAGRAAWRRTVLMAAGTVLLLAVAAQLFDAPGLTGASNVGTALGFLVPVALAGMGGLVSERSGVVNIGLEGMMVCGTWGGGFLGWHMNSAWGALLGGLLGGAIGGAVHALATVSFGVDHTVSGVALNLLAPGVCRYLSSLAFDGKGRIITDAVTGEISKDFGTIADSPSVPAFSRFSVPIVSSGLQSLEGRHWFFVSDVAGVLRGFTTDVAWSTGLLLAVIPIIWYIVWRTPFGLRLRSAGEKPAAAESLGVNVFATKWIAVLMSGALAGLGGAWIVLDSQKYQESQTAQRGFLGLAALIFGNWRPGLLVVGALLFSFSQSVGLQIGQEARGLFGALGIALSVGGILSGLRKQFAEAATLVVMGIGFVVFAFANTEVNPKFTAMLPYVVTLFVLALSSKRLRPPAAAGQQWRKGQGS